jgi:tRNA wybutosine-synthesizing protein 4
MSAFFIGGGGYWVGRVGGGNRWNVVLNLSSSSPLYTGPTTRHSKSLTKNDDEVVFKLRLAQQPTYGILNEAVTRFGHVTWQPQRNKIIVAGGYSPSQSRLCTMTCISSDLKTVLWTQRPTKGVVTHLFGSSCAMFGDRCFVFGGRGSPSDPSDLLLSISLKDCLQVETMITNSGPRPRWGHSLSCWPTSDSLFVIGGRDSKTVFQDIWQFDIEAEKWGPRTVRLPYDLYSHSTAVYKNSLIVTGGLKDFTSCQVNNEVLLYNPEDEVLRTVRPFGAYFGRFGHTSHVISDSRLILVGGVVSCPRDIVVSVIDLNSLHVVNFEANLRLDAPLVQHSSVYDKDRQSVIIFGGGTNCFSFGMHVNSSILSFSLE